MRQGMLWRKCPQEGRKNLEFLKIIELVRIRVAEGLPAAVLGSESARDVKMRSVAVICPLPQSGIVAMRPTSILLKSGRSAWKGALYTH